MAAPALLMLAHGADDPEVHQTSWQLCERLRNNRPNLSVELAFLDGGTPEPQATVATLAAGGAAELVIVPLDLSRAIEADDQTTELAATLSQAHPELSIQVSRPVGPSSSLLTVLDERLRAALRAARTVELDALVLALPRSGDVRGNALVSRRARQWSNHHKLPVVVAVSDGSGASAGQAVVTLRGQGRRHIAVGSMFIGPTTAFRQQVELARAAGAIAISDPIGADDRLLELVMARYSYAAMDMLDPSDLDADAQALADAVTQSEADASPAVSDHEAGGGFEDDTDAELDEY